MPVIQQMHTVSEHMTSEVKEHQLTSSIQQMSEASAEEIQQINERATLTGKTYTAIISRSNHIRTYFNSCDVTLQSFQPLHMEIPFKLSTRPLHNTSQGECTIKKILLFY